MKNNLVVAIIVAVVVGALGFFGGMKYQENKTIKTGNLQFGRGQFGQRAGRNSGAGFRPTAGEIVSSDEISITLKMQDGSTKIVLITDKTTINKAEKAAKSDLKKGERVAVFGQENADGSVTAQTIQINPQTGMMRNR